MSKSDTDSECNEKAMGKRDMSRKLMYLVLDKKKIKDPFDCQHQALLDGYKKHVSTLRRKDVDLTNEGIHLTGVSKIVSARTEIVHRNVLNLAQLVTKTDTDLETGKEECRADPSGRKPRNGKKKDDLRPTQEPLKLKLREQEELPTLTGTEELNPLEQTDRTGMDVDETIEIEIDKAASVVEGRVGLPAEAISLVVLLESPEISECDLKTSENEPDVPMQTQDMIFDPQKPTDIGMMVEGCTSDMYNSEHDFVMTIDSLSCTMRSELNLKVKNATKKVRNTQPATRSSVRIMVPRIPLKRAMVHQATPLRRLKRIKITDHVLDMSSGPDQVSSLSNGADTDPNGWVKNEDISLLELPSTVTTVGVDFQSEDSTVTELEPIPEPTALHDKSTSSFVTKNLNAICIASEDENIIQTLFTSLHSNVFPMESSVSEKLKIFRYSFNKLQSIFQNYGVPLSLTQISANYYPVITNTTRRSSRDIIDDLMTKYRQICEKLPQMSKEDITTKSQQEFKLMRRESINRIVATFTGLPLEVEHNRELLDEYRCIKRRMEKAIVLQSKKEEFDVQKYCRRIIDTVTSIACQNHFYHSGMHGVFTIPSDQHGNSPSQQSQSGDSGVWSSVMNGIFTTPSDSRQDGNSPSQQSQSGDSGVWSPTLSQPYSVFDSMASPASYSQAASENIQEAGSQGIESGIYDESELSSFGEEHCHRSTPASPTPQCYGSKWVPMDKVFYNGEGEVSDVGEVGRNFCAILQLLSTQQLELNYDSFYSNGSNDVAKLPYQNFDKSYATGKNILSSRCPIFGEEVLLAVGSEKSNYFEKAVPDEFISADSGKDIHEKLSEFVEEDGGVYFGKLGGRYK